MTTLKTILITGGGGYVGSALVPKLLAKGYTVRVLDLFIYGDHVFDAIEDKSNLHLIKGDLRDQSVLKTSLVGCDGIIHLACISNDPSFELNPGLGKTINFDAFEPLVDIAIDAGVKRFVYASSSSVYGIKKEPNVTEDLALEPLTDYSKYKAMCEEVLATKQVPGFTTLTVRPATVCGYSPRQRLDVIVNILANHAYHKGVIKVFGGNQLRPNIHINDMVEFYLQSLEWPDEIINGKIYNAGYLNYSVDEIAQMVARAIGKPVDIQRTPTDDNRSYHVSSQKLQCELGFVATHTLEQAVTDLKDAFQDGRLTNTMNNSLYYNIKRMQEVKLA